MSADNLLHPDQFGEVHSTLLGMSLDQIHSMHYSRSPQYMRSLQGDIKRNGFKHPVVVNDEDPRVIEEGHHRAAVAYHLGIPFPTQPESEHNASEPGYRDDTDRWHEKYLKISHKNAGM